MVLFQQVCIVFILSKHVSQQGNFQEYPNLYNIGKIQFKSNYLKQGSAGIFKWGPFYPS